MKEILYRVSKLLHETEVLNVNCYEAFKIYNYINFETSSINKKSTLDYINGFDEFIEDIKNGNAYFFGFKLNIIY